jgi:hypothetical protein
MPFPVNNGTTAGQVNAAFIYLYKRVAEFFAREQKRMRIGIYDPVSIPGFPNHVTTVIGYTPV